MHKRIRWLILALTSPIILPIAYVIIATIILTTIGFHPDAVGWQLAKELARNGRDPHECLQIYHILPHPFSPSGGEQRANCIYEYAKLTKDPSACELLMPSSYGLSCVGAAEESLPCDVESIPYSVYWRDGEIEKTEHLRTCMNSDTGRSTLGNACCEVAKVAFLKDQNDCSPLKANQPIYDHCLYSLAWKLHDPSYCSDISTDNPRSACEVLTQALQKDPSICSGCTPPLESIEDVKNLK